MKPILLATAMVFTVSALAPSFVPEADASGKCRYGEEWDSKSKSCKREGGY